MKFKSRKIIYRLDFQIKFILVESFIFCNEIDLAIECLYLAFNILEKFLSRPFTICFKEKRFVLSKQQIFDLEILCHR